MLSSNVDIVENVEPPNLHVNDVSVGNLHVPENNTNSKTIPSNEPRIQNYSKSFCKKMVIFIRELCLLMLLVLTYATFQNNTPKISKSPNAFPFFPPESVVKDWYRGQLSEAINQASESDLAFVMYYAPWDAESQTVRHEFDIVSQHMHQYVHFAAINCWQPGSECHSQYSKVYSWPVLMAYPAHGRGIQYKGPRTAEHMLKFLQSVLQPFVRITDITELSTYRAQYDAIVVGFVDGKVGSYDYGVLYNSALRFLERDPLREIKYLVVTGKSTPLSLLTAYWPSIQLMMWNETLIYPYDLEWRPQSIVAWIFDNLHQVSVWATPTGSKSQYLTSYLQPGPALILFTPRNPLYDLTDYYTVLHEVAMEYYNCDNNLEIAFSKNILLTIKGTEKDNYLQHKKLLEKCYLNRQTKPETDIPIITYDVSRLLLNNTCSVYDEDNSVCLNVLNRNKKKCDKIVNLNTYKKMNLKFTSHEESTYSNKTNSKKVQNDTNENMPWISILTGRGDFRSPANLQKLADIEKCRFIKIAHNLQPAIFTSRKYYIDFNDNVNGMACKTNMSLSILALDSLLNYQFAESLGIDILKNEDKTAVVIINPKFETHHLMKEPFNITNLRNFIRNFANGYLERILTTTLSLQSDSDSNVYQKHNSTSHTSIQELTTSTFLPTVMKLDQVVIILYHSIKCAFCSGVAHVLLAVARLLSPVSRLQFARIDGDDHALPWEYSMHHYPTILFFPSQRKSESRAFPHNVPITIPNILSFILANVESEMRLHIIWTLCKQSKYDHDLQACARTLRLESSSLVGKMLREYRSSTNPQQNAEVFKRLQHIRLLQFLFTSPTKLYAATIQQYMSMLYLSSQTETNFVQEKL